MDLTFLEGYFIPVIAGICFCIGYGLKQWKKIDNRWIPSLLMIIGIVLNIWIRSSISPEIILGGMVSALSSTGIHQVFKQMEELNKEKEG